MLLFCIILYNPASLVSSWFKSDRNLAESVDWTVNDDFWDAFVADDFKDAIL